MMFKEFGATYVGWIESQNESDIKYIAKHKPELMSAFGYALILSLDSGRSLNVAMPSFAEVIHRRELPLRDCQGRIATDGETIVKLAIEEDFFSGFDQVWFFREPPANIPPDSVYIMSKAMLSTSETVSDEDRNRVRNFLTWRSSSEAAFGLSDGIGLNYFASTKTVAEVLEAVYQQ